MPALTALRPAPVVAGTLALAAGTAWQLQQAEVPASPTLAPIAAAALVAGVVGVRLRRHAVRALVAWAGLGLLLGALAAAAFAGTSWRAAQRLADGLAPALEGADLELTGVVAAMPRAAAQGTRFVFEVEHARWRGQAVRVPSRLSLGWFRPHGAEPGSGGPPELRAGQRWRFVARLRQPHGSFNPGGFDLELWLFEQGLRAVGTVRDTATPAPRLLAEGVAHPVERARQALRDAIVRAVPDAAAAGVLAALVVGDQAAIERDDWDLFRVTGVAHLMSISGLHVTMFAWLAGAAVGALWRRHRRAPLWLATPQAARWGGLLLAAAYALLAGWGVPAQRTVAMLAAVVLLRSAALRWPLPRVLAAAAAVVLLADPWALLQPGFWLSFGAVALLSAAEPTARAQTANTTGRVARLRTALRDGLRTQAVATLGLAPLTLLFFQQVSVVGFAANLLAIPLVTLLITPLALLGVLLPPLWTAAAALVQGLRWALQALAELPGAVWNAAAAPPWAVACGLAGGLLAVLPLPWRLRAWAPALLLPLAWPAVPRPPQGHFELVAADVGQGTAVLLRTAGHLLVYDTGPAYTPEADAGDRVLLPLLRWRGEGAVHRLVLSHRDTDHTGGAASLLAGVAVHSLDSSLADGHPLREAAAARGLPHARCDAGVTWTWDGVRFEFLHPAPDEHRADARPNALSCVLRVAAQDGQGVAVLLPGDLEAAQEAALLRRSADGALRSTGLLVPHHGSRTSSTPAFLDAVAPRWALAQVAYRSRFGHPAPDVVQRYEERGIAFLRSDRCGALTWTSAAPEAAPRCERPAARRYWHHPGAVADGR